MKLPEIRQTLIAADIEGSENDAAAWRHVEHACISRALLVHLGELRRDHELQLGPEQPDTVRPALIEVRHVDEEAGIHVENNALSVFCNSWRMPQLEEASLPPSPEARLVGVSPDQLQRRANMKLPCRSIEDRRVSVIGSRHDIGHLDKNGQIEGAGDNGNVGGRAAIFDHETAQLLGIVIEKLGRSHVVSDEDGVVRQPAQSRAMVVSLQRAEQSVGKIVEVVRALAPEAVAGLHELRAHILLHALDRGLRRKAGRDRLAHTARPAPVVGEHLHRFDDLLVLVVRRRIVQEKAADILFDPVERLIQAFQLGRDVIREELENGRPWLMQRDVTERQAIRKRRSFQGDRCLAAAWRGCDRSRKVARRDHLREHHRRRFERLDLLVRVFRRSILFWTVSTPMVRRSRTMGTPRNE